MTESGYYPPGAEHDPEAPYNESDQFDGDHETFFVDFYVSETDDTKIDRCQIIIGIIIHLTYNHVVVFHVPERAKAYPFYNDDLHNGINNWILNNRNPNKNTIAE